MKNKTNPLTCDGPRCGREVGPGQGIQVDKERLCVGCWEKRCAIAHPADVPDVLAPQARAQFAGGPDAEFQE